MQKAAVLSWLAILILLVTICVGYSKIGEQQEELGKQQEEIDSLRRQLNQLRNEAASAVKVEERVYGMLGQLRVVKQTADNGLELARQVDQRLKKIEKHLQEP